MPRQPHRGLVRFFTQVRKPLGRVLRAHVVRSELRFEGRNHKLHGQAARWGAGGCGLKQECAGFREISFAYNLRCQIKRLRFSSRWKSGAAETQKKNAPTINACAASCRDNAL